MRAAVGAKHKSITEPITDVIVYHGRALVTRTIELDNSTGDIELLVENLPEQILPESIYAQAADGIQVLSVFATGLKKLKKTCGPKCRLSMNNMKTIEKQLHQVKRDNQLAL